MRAALDVMTTSVWAFITRIWVLSVSVLPGAAASVVVSLLWTMVPSRSVETNCKFWCWIIACLACSAYCIEGIITSFILEGGFACSITTKCCSTFWKIEELMGFDASTPIALFLCPWSHASSLSLFSSASLFALLSEKVWIL